MTQIDEVKSRLDIVDLVGGYVTLQRSGSSFKANCPFHQERTPSFYVFPDRQSWRCFGACAEGGDAFGFVMKAERVDFREALHRLAARVGVTLANPTEGGGRTRPLYDINDAARLFYQQQLEAPEAQFVRDYIRQRGLTERSRQIFEFGYSPARGNRLLAHLTELGYAPGQVEEAGLARQTDDGRYYDLFRGRLMIPIRDWQARVAGFGSRALDENATAKYLNTPRTPVFDKSRILFAMHLAKEPIRQRGAVIVEGYMDAIMAHQHGYDNVVASMGTALTEQQVAQVKRLTGRVTMALDGDAAGQNATLRSLESSWGAFQQVIVQAAQSSSGASPARPPEGLELLVAELPAGQDPDDMIRTDPEAWPAFLGQATPLLDYLIATLSPHANLDNPESRAWLLRSLLRFVAQIPDPLVRDGHLEKLSQRLGVEIETLHANLPIAAAAVGNPAGRNGEDAGGPGGRRRAVSAAGDDAGPPAPGTGSGAAIEFYLLALLEQHGAELGADAAVDVSDWLTSENREIYYCVINGIYADEYERAPGVAPELEPRLAELRGKELRIPGPSGLRRAWQQVCLAAEHRHLKRENQQLTAALADTNDWDSPIAAALVDNKNRIREIDRLLNTTVATSASRQP